MNAPGKKKIKISSIIFLVYAGFTCILALASFIIAGTITREDLINELANSYGDEQQYRSVYESALDSNLVSTSKSALEIAGFAYALSAAFHLVFGIWVLRNAANLEKAKAMKVWGIILIVFSVLTFFSIDSVLSFFVNVLWIAIYILFLGGAVENNNAYKIEIESAMGNNDIIEEPLFKR